ncbi:glycosylphosphatidylinositol anchor attachment 1 protein-like [Scylla paramamosain]|uniref:glycosylphosphatidylinositol anchor attachment 1 protein-like n=1 Tax=Scylla paramamosain TaxID=85552 RepID=UPI003082F725
MGLLTDPGMDRSPLPALLERHHRPLCVCLYVCGCLWFLSLAHNALNHGTYFSENALLPGLVQGDFQGDSEALHYLQSLQEEAESHPSSMPHSWLVGQFTQLGLDTFTHSFTLQYPMGRGKNFTGRNVYAILRASRGSGTEALVVTAPYRPPAALLPGTAPSIALMLAMAKFFSRQVYWAKDIIFLVTEHEQLGAQAWLEAYHSPQPLFPSQPNPASPSLSLLLSGDLEGRAGAIQAGINLEVHSAEVTHLDVKLEGLNGQLPNLDLVNLIHRLCQRENVPHTFKNRADHPRPESMEGWRHQLTTLLSMVTSQASGVPTGNHGLFHRYGVAAVTISGSGREAGGGVGVPIRARSISLQQVGRVLEGVCRSLNNLLEKFHQSFFFYLLPATNRYISIGVYMPPFGLIAGGVLVKALALWYKTSCADDSGKGRHSLLQWAPVVVGTHATCFLLMTCPPTLTRLGLAFDLTPEDSVGLGLTACCVALLLVAVGAARSMKEAGIWEVLKICVLLELGVLLFAGAVYNFSLALLVAVIYTPTALLASPSTARIPHLLKSLLLLLVHPLALLFGAVLLDTNTHFPEASPLRLLWRTVTGSKRALMYSVVDSLVYSNWVFDVGALCLLPLWCLLWLIVHLHVDVCVSQQAGQQTPQPQLGEGTVKESKSKSE